MSGWAVASGGAETVALDLELTHELRLLGLVRDVVRVVQDAAQERRPRGHRPDRAVVAGRRLTRAGRGDPRPCGPDRRGGARH